jgi:hypothetical protein
MGRVHSRDVEPEPAEPFNPGRGENEKRLRIRLAVFAYAYEVLNISFVSDAEFDRLSRKVNLRTITDDRKLDDFFRREFDPSTGMWVLKHPQIKKIAALAEYYKKFYKPRPYVGKDDEEEEYDVARNHSRRAGPRLHDRR